MTQPLYQLKGWNCVDFPHTLRFLYIFHIEESRDGISDNRYIGFFVNIGYRYRLETHRLKYRISPKAKYRILANDKISDIGWGKISDIGKKEIDHHLTKPSWWCLRKWFISLFQFIIHIYKNSCQLLQQYDIDISNWYKVTFFLSVHPYNNFFVREYKTLAVKPCSWVQQESPTGSPFAAILLERATTCFTVWLSRRKWWSYGLQFDEQEHCS